MKKIISFILVAILCLGALTSCDLGSIGDKVGGVIGSILGSEEAPDTAGLDAAKAYLEKKYSNEEAAPSADYDLVAKVAVNDVTYDVVWTVNVTGISIKASSKAGFWTVDLPDENAVAKDYVLTATITDPQSKTATVSFNRTLPVIEKASETCEHVWNSGEVTTAATCKDAGVMTYTCTKCPETKTEAIAKLTTHTPGAAATCKDAQTCTVCGVELAAKTNNHSYEGGTCSVCGAQDPNYQPPSADCTHAWDAGTVTKAATCKDAGVMTYTCSKCQGNKTEPIAKLTTHTPGAAATCKDAQTCEVCGVELAAKTNNHSFGDNLQNCSVCGTPNPNYQAPQNPPAAGTTVTITFDDTSKRVTFTEEQQIWQENGIKVTNNKANASSPVANYSNPVRFYKNSEVVVEMAGMTKIVFNCSTNEYSGYLAEAIGSTATVDGKAVTVVFASAENSFTVALTKGKVFVSSIEVTTGSSAPVCNHSWDNGEVTTAATCITAGVKTFTCTVNGCGQTKTETINPTGAHAWNAGAVTKAATCKEAGVMTYTCTTAGCNQTKTEDIAKLTTHTPGAAATCTTAQICTVCDVVIEEALGHTEPNADEQCDRCFIDLSCQHTWDAGTVTKAATCYTAGVMTYTCTVSGCGQTTTEPINPTGAHVWNAGDVTKAATCKEAGVMTYTCTTAGCNKTKTEDIAKLTTHTPGAAATCKNAQICTVCGVTLADKLTTHTPGAAATCKDAQICEVCGVELAAKTNNHSFGDNLENCSVCGTPNPNYQAPNPPAAGTTVTITFDDTSKRVTFTEEQQIWQENGIKVTNNKANASSPVADYSKPVRFYKNSEVVVELAGMTKIVFNCSSTEYSGYLAEAIGSIATVDGKVVTVVFASAENSFTVALTKGKVFVNSIEVTANGSSTPSAPVCNHSWNSGSVTTAATCETKGVMTYTCTVSGCGQTKTEDIKATGHNYQGGVCINTGCGKAEPQNPGSSSNPNLAPVIGEAYYLTTEIDGKTYYFVKISGSGQKVTVTENVNEAAKVYVEAGATAGEYYLYYNDGGVKYICYNGSSTNFKTSTSKPSTAWVYTEAGAWQWGGASGRFIGTQTGYTNMGAYAASNLTSDNYSSAQLVVID